MNPAFARRIRALGELEEGGAEEPMRHPLAASADEVEAAREAQRAAALAEADTGALDAAREDDATARLLSALGLAGRQVASGLSLTPVQQGVSFDTGREARETERQKQMRAEALKRMEIGSRAKDATLEREKMALREKELESLDVYRKGGVEERAAERERRTTKDKTDAELEREKLAAALAKKGGPRQGLAAGYELTGETNPDKQDLRKHGDLVAAAEKMRGLTQGLRKQLAGMSTAQRLNPMSAKRNEMKQLATMIAIEGKNIAELGALSGPDYALMQTIAADPTSLLSMTKDMGAVLDRLDGWAENSVQAKTKALGLRRKGGAAPVQTSAPGGGETKQVGGKTYRKTGAGWELVR